jgi:hypothetical protein
METSTRIINYHLLVAWRRDFQKSGLQEERVEKGGCE